MLKYCQGSSIHNEFYGSDHCPIQLKIDFEPKNEKIKEIENKEVQEIEVSPEVQEEIEVCPEDVLADEVEAMEFEADKDMEHDDFTLS